MRICHATRASFDLSVACSGILGGVPMSLLDPNELAQLLPAETHSFPSPIPTQFVSSDEFMPAPQTERQKQVEARIKALGSQLAKHQGLSRRKFFKTASG